MSVASFDTIIVPLDGSALAEHAVPYAVALHRLTGARIVLLRVLEQMHPFYDPRRREVVWLDPERPRLDLMSEEILKPTVDRLAGQGITARPVVRLGDPRKEIVAEAAAQGQPLLVLASHGRGGLGRAWLGSVATRVVQTAPCPTLVIRPREEGAETLPEVRFSRIAVPLDGSALAEQALPVAVALARAAGAALLLVRVAETYREELPPEPERSLIGPSLAGVLRQFEAMEDEAREYLRAVAGRLAAEPVSVEWEVRSGDPARALLAFLNETHPDLIVMTTHGRGGLARWFYGSVADRLLTSSQVPLLLIRAQATAE